MNEKIKKTKKTSPAEEREAICLWVDQFAPKTLNDVRSKKVLMDILIPPGSSNIISFYNNK